MVSSKVSLLEDKNLVSDFLMNLQFYTLANMKNKHKCKG